MGRTHSHSLAVRNDGARAGGRRESGFAMLLVFVMAATIAIMLYKELPRLVFESQRIQEQELIDRGEQYRRAIQLYVRKFKRYPASLDDLEHGANIRFLRRRYKDPMTGADDWRLIHINNAGIYTDSLIHKPKKEEQKKSQNTFISEGAAFGSTGASGATDQQKGGAAVRGASDRPAAAASRYQALSGAQPTAQQRSSSPQYGATGNRPGFPGRPGQPSPYGYPPAGQSQPGTPASRSIPFYRMRPGGVNAAPAYPSQPGQVPRSFFPPAGSTRPGVVGGRPYPYPQSRTGVTTPRPNSGYPGGAGQYIVPGQLSPLGGRPPAGTSPAHYPNQGIPGLPGPYGQRQQQQQPGSSPFLRPPSSPFPGAGSRQPRQQSPMAGGALPGQPANPALGLIGKILTSPRPGGLTGITGMAGQASGIGGGIAGVACPLDTEGIMVYHGRTKYNEWEFLYDIREDRASRTAAAMRGAGVGNRRNPLGGQQQQRSRFGGASSFGGFGGRPVPPAPRSGGR